MKDEGYYRGVIAWRWVVGALYTWGCLASFGAAMESGGFWWAVTGFCGLGVLGSALEIKAAEGKIKLLRGGRE